MSSRGSEGRWLLLGILISSSLGIAVALITHDTLLVIATGMISALIVQHLRRLSEKRRERHE